MSQRIFTPLELNHLRRFGYQNIDVSIVGEKPVEYITGHAEFCGLDFLVTPSVLIPRIETEKIIDLATSFVQKLKTTANIADIGTGSGCVGITLAKRLIDQSAENFDLYFSDLSPKALEVARGNALRLLPKNQSNLHFIESDLLDNYPPHTKLDLVIANLPYIPSPRLSFLDPSVKNFEPINALIGGDNGYEMINKLLAKVPSFLKPNSLIILEIDSEHKLSDFDIPQNLKGFIEKDLFGRNRFLILEQKI